MSTIFRIIFDVVQFVRVRCSFLVPIYILYTPRFLLQVHRATSSVIILILKIDSIITILYLRTIIGYWSRALPTFIIPRPKYFLRKIYRQVPGMLIHKKKLTRARIYIIIISVGDLIGTCGLRQDRRVDRTRARVGVNGEHAAGFSVAFGLISSKQCPINVQWFFIQASRRIKNMYI